MEKVIVTGGSGKIGRRVIAELAAQGCQAINLDLTPPPAGAGAPFTAVDMTDFGQVMDAFRGVDARLEGADALIHLAAIPGPGHLPDAATFHANVAGAYNAFAAAVRLGLRRVVWASSSSVTGTPFAMQPPPYAPLDEEAPVRAEWSYAMSKVVAEELARQFSHWRPEMPFVGLRIAAIMEPEDYEGFADFWDDPHRRKWNLWGYVDVRDAARACRQALAAEVDGADVFLIAAADTVMNRPSRDLMAEIYPEVRLTREIGEYETLLAIDKARSVLGYQPQFSWRQEV